MVVGGGMVVGGWCGVNFLVGGMKGVWERWEMLLEGLWASDCLENMQGMNELDS